MATAFLNTTTVTSAVTSSQRAIPVASNANHTVGEYIILGGEAMLVQSKNGTTITNVERGQLGTSARAHQNAALVYGSTTTLGPTQYEPFSGEQRVTRADVPPADLPTYPVNLGQKKRDGLGNEYMLVDFGEAVFPQQPVAISSAFVASALGITGRGAVGVVAETGACTSDQWGWVQIYGRCLVQLAAVGSSPSDAANGPTTSNGSTMTRFALPTSTCAPTGVTWTSDVSSGSGYQITGMKVASDASVGDVSATTSGANGGHQGTAIAVFLNYPEITYIHYTSVE